MSGLFMSKIKLTYYDVLLLSQLMLNQITMQLQELELQKLLEYQRYQTKFERLHYQVIQF